MFSNKMCDDLCMYHLTVCGRKIPFMFVCIVKAHQNESFRNCTNKLFP